MRYMWLIYSTGGVPESQSPDILPAYMAFSQEVREKGVMGDGEPAPARRHRHDSPRPRREDGGHG